jgi:hypothetical protein
MCTLRYVRVFRVPSVPLQPEDHLEPNTRMKDKMSKVDEKPVRELHIGKGVVAGVRVGTDKIVASSGLNAIKVWELL